MATLVGQMKLVPLVFAAGRFLSSLIVFVRIWSLLIDVSH